MYDVFLWGCYGRLVCPGKRLSFCKCPVCSNNLHKNLFLFTYFKTYVKVVFAFAGLFLRGSKIIYHSCIFCKRKRLFQVQIKFQTYAFSSFIVVAIDSLMWFINTLYQSRKRFLFCPYIFTFSWVMHFAIGYFTKTRSPNMIRY